MAKYQRVLQGIVIIPWDQLDVFNSFWERVPGLLPRYEHVKRQTESLLTNEWMEWDTLCFQTSCKQYTVISDDFGEYLHQPTWMCVPTNHEGFVGAADASSLSAPKSYVKVFQFFQDVAISKAKTIPSGDVSS